MTSIYEKIYLRENSLVALQIWDNHQTEPIKELWGKGYQPFVWDVHEGVASVYAEQETFAWIQQVCAERAKDPTFITSWLTRYEKALVLLEEKWKTHRALESHAELVAFCDLVIEGWVGLEVTYFAPMVEEGLITKEEREACLRLRERAIAFLDDSDFIILETLRLLYPKVANLVHFIGLDEMCANQLPSQEELERRSQHFVLHAGKIHTRITLQAFLKTQNIALKQDVPDREDEVRGQVAMPGKAAGRAYVLLKKSEVDRVQEGDILISGMTIPDYLPAMKRAAAFVTDEGGVTCHAAIVAREFGKPCVIGTKFATQLIQTGDWISVDADTGLVTIKKQS